MKIHGELEVLSIQYDMLASVERVPNKELRKNLNILSINKSLHENPKVHYEAHSFQQS